MLQNVTVLGDRAFKEVIKFKKFLSVGPNSTWLVFLLGIRRQREKHQTHAHIKEGSLEDTARRWAKNEVTDDIKAADILNFDLDVKTDKMCLLFKPPSLQGLAN